MDGAFGHQKGTFFKTLSKVDLFENAVFLLSCERAKTELFEHADITAAIYHPSDYLLGSLWIARGHFVYLFLNFEYHNVFVWKVMSSKTLLVWMQVFFGKSRCIFENIRICVDVA